MKEIMMQSNTPRGFNLHFNLPARDGKEVKIDSINRLRDYAKMQADIQEQKNLREIADAIEKLAIKGWKPRWDSHFISCSKTGTFNEVEADFGEIELSNHKNHISYEVLPEDLEAQFQEFDAECESVNQPVPSKHFTISFSLGYKPCPDMDIEGCDVEDTNVIREYADSRQHYLHKVADALDKLHSKGWHSYGCLFDISCSKTSTLAEVKADFSTLGLSDDIKMYDVEILEDIDDSGELHEVQYVQLAWSSTMYLCMT